MYSSMTERTGVLLGRTRQRWGFSDWATGALKKAVAAARAGEPTSINGLQAAVATAASMTECAVHLLEHVRLQMALSDAAMARCVPTIGTWASAGLLACWPADLLGSRRLHAATTEWSATRATSGHSAHPLQRKAGSERATAWEQASASVGRPAARLLLMLRHRSKTSRARFDDERRRV